MSWRDDERSLDHHSAWVSLWRGGTTAHVYKVALDRVGYPRCLQGLVGYPRHAVVDKERQLLTQHRPSVGILVTDVSVGAGANWGWAAGSQPSPGGHWPGSTCATCGFAGGTSGQVALVPLAYLLVWNQLTSLHRWSAVGSTFIPCHTLSQAQVARFVPLDFVLIAPSFLCIPQAIWNQLTRVQGLYLWCVFNVRSMNFTPLCIFTLGTLFNLKPSSHQYFSFL